MTTAEQRIKETPMAPYTSLLRGMTREQKRIVVMFITESMEEPKTPTPPENLVEMARRKYNVPESPRAKWFREHARPKAWSKQEEWNHLTPDQKAFAKRLNLGVEDMDARTVGLLTKHAK